jgi:hypothetical protein
MSLQWLSGRDLGGTGRLSGWPWHTHSSLSLGLAFATWWRQPSSRASATSSVDYLGFCCPVWCNAVLAHANYLGSVQLPWPGTSVYQSGKQPAVGSRSRSERGRLSTWSIRVDLSHGIRHQSFGLWPSMGAPLIASHAGVTRWDRWPVLLEGSSTRCFSRCSLAFGADRTCDGHGLYFCTRLTARC